MDETAQQQETVVSPWLRRIRRGLWVVSAIGPASLGAIWRVHGWHQMPVALTVASGIEALTIRVLIHRHLGYRTLLRKEYDGELAYTTLAALGLGLTLLPGHHIVPAEGLLDAGHFAAFGYALLAVIVIAYGLLDDAMARTRGQQNVPTATDWIRGRTAWGHDLGALSEEGENALSRTVDAVTRSHDKAGRRLIREGATLAGTLVVMLFTSTTISYASSSVSHYVMPKEDKKAQTALPTPPMPSATPAQPQYDDICGRGSLQPGDTAPEWAQMPLHRLWLSSRTGVGGILAGCVHPVEIVPGQPDVVYQLGYLNGQLRGVGVSTKEGPTTLYLDDAAAEVLALLKSGRVVVGRNGGVRHSLTGIVRLPSGRLYVP